MVLDESKRLKRNAIHRAYYHRNKEKCQAYVKDWVKRNPDYQRLYRERRRRIKQFNDIELYEAMIQKLKIEVEKLKKEELEKIDSPNGLKKNLNNINNGEKQSHSPNSGEEGRNYDTSNEN